MEFRRITGLPPYVFAIINDLKIDARRAGRDVIDLGFGNPDLASPEIAVDKMAEAVRNSRNHRYSQSRGLPKLRKGKYKVRVSYRPSTKHSKFVRSAKSKKVTLRVR